jgi:SAM-dependent methyltransferase
VTDLERLDARLHRLEQLRHRLENATDNAIRGLESLVLPDCSSDGLTFPWHACPVGIFVPALETAIHAVEDRGEPLHFLDVGCGIGTKMLLAGGLLLQTFGIEKRPEYAQIAARLGLKVQVADAMEWDHYSAFDIVYTYRLFLGAEDQMRFEDRLFRLVAPGAVLITVGGEQWPDLEGWETLGNFVWRKPAA